MSKALHDVIAERRRQVEQEGWTAQHDDVEHTAGALALAAACYAVVGAIPLEADRVFGRYWPWTRDWWKPTEPRRNLVKAAALILAEIERLDREAGTVVPPDVFVGEHQDKGMTLYRAGNGNVMLRAQLGHALVGYGRSLDPSLLEFVIGPCYMPEGAQPGDVLDGDHIGKSLLISLIFKDADVAKMLIDYMRESLLPPTDSEEPRHE